MTVKQQLLTLILIIGAISSCKDECSDQRDFITAGSSTMKIEYRNQNGDFLIKDNGGLYQPSDISVFDEGQKKVRFNLFPISSGSVPKHYVLSISILETGMKYEYGRVYKRKIFVDFKTSQDVIDFEFKIKNLACGDILESLDVTYNGKHVASIKDDFYVTFDIIK